MMLGYILISSKTSDLMTDYPVPGSHIVVHHIVGPRGANGTQQFPKLTDYDLVCILKPFITEHIINVYCKEGGKNKNAQCILANLKPIAKCAKVMFCNVEAEHGYCSCECVAAIQRNQAAQGQLCDLVYRALMVCFTFADLQIQLDKIGKKHDPKPSAPQLPSEEPSEETLKRLIERLHELHKESEMIHKIILQHPANK